LRNTIGNGTVVTIRKADEEKIAVVATQLSFQAQKERRKRGSAMRSGLVERSRSLLLRGGIGTFRIQAQREDGGFGAFLIELAVARQTSQSGRRDGFRSVLEMFP